MEKPKNKIKKGLPEKEKIPPEGFVTLADAAKSSPYSQEYISLLARKGKIFAKKFGRNWFTTESAINEYLKDQGIKIVLPKSIFNHSYKGKISKPFEISLGDAILADSGNIDPEIIVPQHSVDSPKRTYDADYKTGTAKSRVGENEFADEILHNANKSAEPNQDNIDDAEIITMENEIVKAGGDAKKLNQFAKIIFKWKNSKAEKNKFIDTAETIMGEKNRWQITTLNQPVKDDALPTKNSKIIPQKLNQGASAPNETKDVFGESLKFQKTLGVFPQKPSIDTRRSLKNSEPFVGDKKSVDYSPAGSTIEEKILERLYQAFDRYPIRKGISGKAAEFDQKANSLLHSPIKMMAISISAIVLLFLLIGGISFGNLDQTMVAVKNFFNDAETLQGKIPGTHANEVLLLDKNGNVSIYGHIETQGQIRSWVQTGVAPIVVDSVTKVENLNADYLDNVSSEGFTLAFVTKNGNITYEDVNLEGSVEVGKSLNVKGPTKLLDSLLVYGELESFGKLLARGGIDTKGANLNLGIGTIEITNRNLVSNLNAEMVGGKKATDFTLDYVVSQGASTDRTIILGGMFATNASFDNLSTRLFNASGDVILGKNDRSADVVVNAKGWQVTSAGSMSLRGTLNVAGTTTLASPLSVTSSSTPQVRIGYNSNNYYDTIVASLGAVTFDAVGTGASFIFDDDTTISGDLSVAGNFIAPYIYGSSADSGNLTLRSTTSATKGNVILADDGGNIGIGTASPNQKLEIQGSANQIRLSNSSTPATNYAELGVDDSGNLTIDTQGIKTILGDDLQINGNDILSSNGSTVITLVGSDATLSGSLTILGNTISATSATNVAIGSTGADTIIIGNGGEARASENQPGHSRHLLLPQFHAAL